MVRPTTLLSSVRLNRCLGLDILLASETFQHTGNFKFRGAWHMASNVPHHHLLTSSSGNFGQALAFACQELNKRCTVVMPDDSVTVKVEAVREFGGSVELVDTRTITRDARVAELARQYPEAYVASGFDDELMITGNSTLGRELAKLQEDIDAIVAPISGGGLASGILKGLRRESADIPLIGAEPLLANHVTRSIRAGHIVRDKEESKNDRRRRKNYELGRA